MFVKIENNEKLIKDRYQNMLDKAQKEKEQALQKETQGNQKTQTSKKGVKNGRIS